MSCKDECECSPKLDKPLLKCPIQHLYPLEIGCREDSAYSQPEKSTTNVKNSETPSRVT